MPRAACFSPAGKRTVPAECSITGDISVEEAQDIIARDPYTRADVARYERMSFNGAFRAPGI